MYAGGVIRPVRMASAVLSASAPDPLQSLHFMAPPNYDQTQLPLVRLLPWYRVCRRVALLHHLELDERLHDSSLSGSMPISIFFMRSL